MGLGRWCRASAFLLLPWPACAAPAALVIGESAYTHAPALESCALSANAIASALRRDGFEVRLVSDASNGGISAALGGPVAVLYACAYASSDGGRTFLLPVEASLDRPADAVTEGVLARALAEFPVRAGAPVSLVVLDTVPWPNGAPAPDWSSVRALTLPAGHAVAAATETAGGTGPTAVAAALVEALQAPRPDAVTIASGLSKIATVRTSGGPAPLMPPPPHPPSAPKPVAAPLPATIPAPPAPVIPDEDKTDLAQREAVQTALRSLGYYPGTIDGIYGPDSRAAMRRFQHEIGHEMTGRLTGDEASRLVRGTQ